VWKEWIEQRCVWSWREDKTPNSEIYNTPFLGISVLPVGNAGPWTWGPSMSLPDQMSVTLRLEMRGCQCHCCTWCSDRPGGDLGLLEVVSLIIGPLNIAVLPDIYQIGKSLRQFIWCQKGLEDFQDLDKDFSQCKVALKK